jgi:hypothetical protein
MHFLDICAVDVTKRSQTELAANPRKAALVTRLRDLDKPGNRVSYLMALMEKVSDTKSSLSDAELRANIINDVNCMRSFFVNARVPEPDEFLLGYLDQLRGRPVELAKPAYLKFLRTANDRFRLADPVSPRKRFEVTEQLVATADRLRIKRQHAVLVVTLACVYGNASARKVMKFKADPQAFDAENVLADIMTIGRFLERKLVLEEDARRGLTSIRRVLYITDDAGLEEVLGCYEGLALSSRDLDGHHEVRTTGRVEFAKLLTEISHDAGPLRNPADPTSSAPSEYDRVCALVCADPASASGKDGSLGRTCSAAP